MPTVFPAGSTTFKQGTSGRPPTRNLKTRSINDGRILVNREAGWLLRTKPHGNDEGGVLTQGGCLDSVSLT